MFALFPDILAIFNGPDEILLMPKCSLGSKAMDQFVINRTKSGNQGNDLRGECGSGSDSCPASECGHFRAVWTSSCHWKDTASVYTSE